MRNFMDLSRALKGLADAFHTIKLKLDGLYDSAGAIGGKYELIEEIRLTEAVASIERNAEPGGADYSFSDVLITSYIPNTSETAAQGVYNVNNTVQWGVTNTIAASAFRYNKFELNDNHGIFKAEAISASGIGTQGGSILWPRVDESVTITSIKIGSNPVSVQFPVDSVFKIYAIRK